jgi:hypothetical protein
MTEGKEVGSLVKEQGQPEQDRRVMMNLNKQCSIINSTTSAAIAPLTSRGQAPRAEVCGQLPEL